jgi:hypothetical protein
MEALPTNPFNGSQSVIEVIAKPAAGDATTGWFFNTTTGQICPGDDKKSPDDTLHIDL